MFVGLNKDGIRTDVADSNKEEEYFCPICNGRLRIKDGQIKVKHFAHISLQECDDFSSDMSEWHRKWQEQFPLKNREVVIEFNGEKHRADVLAYGHVIEFQHSPISCEEFNRRNKFYTSAGKNVIWIFDLTHELLKSQKLRCLRKNSKGREWEWLYSKKCFKDFIPHVQKNIVVFFHLSETDFLNEENHHYIERVTWAARYMLSSETSFRYFETSYYPGTKKELLDWIKHEKKQEVETDVFKDKIVQKNSQHQIVTKKKSEAFAQPSLEVPSVICYDTENFNFDLKHIVYDSFGNRLCKCVVCGNIFCDSNTVWFQYAKCICRSCYRSQSYSLY